MKKQWKRLVTAAICSSSVFAVTYYWYKSTDQSANSHGNEKPLAYVGKVVDDIQRRPAARLLWQLVNTGEPLYNGEAVRTSERGEVRIQFTDSDRYLDLEPESLIVIKKSEGEIALDLMEGSLFVNAKADSNSAGADKAPGLVLSSANGKVDLSHASASLSKGRGNAVDVQVLEGKASIQGKDGQSKELTTGSYGALGASGLEFNKNNLKILSPAPSKPIAMDAEDLKEIPFKWTGFPTNSEVSLWTGETRRDLKFLAKAPAGQSELAAKLPFGKHYWKLVATNPQNQQVIGESPTFRSEILARYAPTVVFPTADAEIPANTMPFDMSFKWQKGDDTRSVTLEVWTDPGLKNKVLTKSFTSEEAYTLPAIKEGTYYWRMSSYYVESTKPFLGKVQKFSVKPTAQVHLEAAKPQVIPVNVAFTMPQAPQYYVDSPTVGLTWNVDKTDKVSSYRVKVYGEDNNPTWGSGIDVKENKISRPVPKPGRYIASVEALDKDGQVMGTTKQTLDVAPLPILQSPTFLPAEGILQAGIDGRSTLEWSKVEGAKEYWLVVKKNGKQLKRSKYNVTSTSLRNLLPGEYDVEISAVDNYGRSSEISPSRKLLVPDKSGLRAPTVKKIKVN